VAGQRGITDGARALGKKSPYSKRAENFSLVGQVKADRDTLACGQTATTANMKQLCQRPSPCPPPPTTIKISKRTSDKVAHTQRGTGTSQFRGQNTVTPVGRGAGGGCAGGRGAGGGRAGGKRGGPGGGGTGGGAPVVRAPVAGTLAAAPVAGAGAPVVACGTPAGGAPGAPVRGAPVEGAGVLCVRRWQGVAGAPVGGAPDARAALRPRQQTYNNYAYDNYVSVPPPSPVPPAPPPPAPPSRSASATVI